MALAAFGMILVLSRAGFEAEHIDDFRGLNDRSPWLAFLMRRVMMSMAGIPFLVSFYAKRVVLQGIISEGFIGLGDSGRRLLRHRRVLLPAGGQVPVL